MWDLDFKSSDPLGFGWLPHGSDEFFRRHLDHFDIRFCFVRGKAGIQDGSEMAPKELSKRQWAIFIPMFVLSSLQDGSEMTPRQSRGALDNLEVASPAKIEVAYCQALRGPRESMGIQGGPKEPGRPQGNHRKLWVQGDSGGTQGN
jgi:hypothetical protein